MIALFKLIVYAKHKQTQCNPNWSFKKKSTMISL